VAANGFHGRGFHGRGFDHGFHRRVFVGGFGFYGPYGYDDYYDYPYYADNSYYDDSYYGGYGGCYIVQQRVHTRHGWRIQPTQVCG
jgi:hypothetical protein